jgi:fatty-acyl-CoA synthase
MPNSSNERDGVNSAPPRSRHLWSLLEEIRRARPHAPAIIWNRSVISFDQWANRASRLSAWLSFHAGGNKGAVGLLMSNRPEWLFTYFGAARLGVPLVAISTWSTERELAYFLAHPDLRVLITMDRFRGLDYLDMLEHLVPEAWSGPPGTWRSSRYPQLEAIVVLGGHPPPGAYSFDDVLQEPSPLATKGFPSQSKTAIVVYTSGSTSLPKAVPLEHSALIENGFNIGERMELQGEDRIWLAVPLFWSYGSVNALMAGLTHACAFVLEETFDPGEALDLFETESCTVAYTLPNMTRALTDHPSFTPARTRSLRTGLTIGHAREIRHAAAVLGATRICNVYGATETYGNACVTPADAALEERLVAQGPPLPGVSIRIVRPNGGSEQKPNHTGEIWVQGYVSPGYLRSSGEADRITPDGIFRSGDLGYLDEKGWLHFKGRRTEMIKSRGINVSPVEVEDCLLEFRGVQEAAVVGVPAGVDGESVVAFVVVDAEGVGPTEEQLRTYCREQLSAYKTPTRVVFVDDLPRTSTNKLSRQALTEQATSLFARQGTHRV